MSAIDLISLEPRPVSGSAAPGWMITFADLLSLLLAFFVMMFATTSIDKPAWQRSVEPLARYFSGHPPAKPEAVVAARPTVQAPKHDADYVAALLEHLVDTAAAFKGGTVRHVGNEIVLGVPVGQVAKETLIALAPLVAGLDNRIDIRVVLDADAGQSADQSWHRAVEQAMADAASFSKLGDGHAVGALGAVEILPKSAGERTEFVIYDDKAERSAS